MRLLSDTVQCPTCRANQEWSDNCRRCRGDLSLLRALADAYRDHRARCLVLLRSDRPAEALDQARRCADIEPGPDAERLVAVCALLSGDWATARTLATGEWGA